MGKIFFIYKIFCFIIFYVRLCVFFFCLGLEFYIGFEKVVVNFGRELLLESNRGKVGNDGIFVCKEIKFVYF